LSGSGSGGNIAAERRLPKNVKKTLKYKQGTYITIQSLVDASVLVSLNKEIKKDKQDYER